MKKPSLAAVTQIGCTAYGLLSKDQTATVMGITSRGVYLGLVPDNVVFLSSEPYRGPLTIHISPYLASCFQVGEKLVIRESCLQLNACSIVFDLREAETWEAPGLPESLLAVDQFLSNLGMASAEVLSRRGGIGLSRLLEGLLDLPGGAALETGFDSPEQHLARLTQAVESCDMEVALVAAEGLLGLGSGLTPSGDDLLLGLVLALTRWGNTMGICFETYPFTHALVEKARQRTTTLSAALLACAGQGQADERLVAALDGLLTGQLTPSVCADQLLRWGSSSGCDALVGMAVAILAFASFRRRDVL